MIIFERFQRFGMLLGKLIFRLNVLLGEAVLLLLVPALLLGLFLYFLPWLSAIERDSPQRTAIGLTNLFFGWSLLGWVIALIWSAKRYDFK